MTDQRQGTVVRTIVRRFRESVAITHRICDGKGGFDVTETHYIPREMLLILRDALEQAHRDISTKQFSASTFKSRTILTNGEVLW